MDCIATRSSDGEREEWMMMNSVEDLFSDRIDLFLPCPNSQSDQGNNEERFVANPKYRESSDAVAM